MNVTVAFSSFSIKQINPKIGMGYVMKIITGVSLSQMMDVYKYSSRDVSDSRPFVS